MIILGNKKEEPTKPTTNIETTDKVVISFNSNGGDDVEKVTVEKGEKAELPVATRTGFIFAGWYLEDTKIGDDYEFTKDVTLTAKWTEVTEDVKTLTVTFDANGGSKVNKLTVECDTKLKLPQAPKKEGYTFTNWIRKNGKVVNNGEVLACEDITLYANWTKEETTTITTTTTTTTKKVSYSCPSGYTLNGTKCVETKNASYGCDITHEKEIGGKCYSVRTYKQATCKIQTGSTNGGSTPILSDGIVIYKDSTYAYCAYDKQNSLAACNGFPERIINGSNCYARVETRPVSGVCESGYEYMIGNALYGTTEQTTGAKTGCYSSVAKHNYCETGYTLSGDKCTKTIDATAN